ncbi:MAG TPA: tyrosine-type recombinase/integrase, partial [Gammaproteobacteria bacterium]|nr:tyrosine-type recombinase/integrase [Gammaproteobacteria bacterium]
LDGVIDKNPFDHLDYLETDATIADPFSSLELQRVLTTATHRIQELNYIEFACFSGVSASEGIAIAYEDIDWNARTVSIKRACVLGVYKRPKKKTRQRTLKLFDQAYDALLRQKQHSFMQPPVEIEVLEFDNKTVTRETLHFVFLNSLTGKPFSDSKECEKFWKWHLQKVGLRYRGINQCRHTFASRLLSCGRYPEKWIAEYLGHTSTAMLHKHYGRWMGQEHPDLERQASRDLALPGIEHRARAKVEEVSAAEQSAWSQPPRSSIPAAEQSDISKMSPLAIQFSDEDEKPQLDQLHIWRRGRDSNPRWSF